MNRPVRALPAELLPHRGRGDGSIRGLGTAPDLDPVGETRRDRDPTVADYVWTVVEGRWTVAGVAASCLAAAFAYLFLAAPVYESNALVQVQDRPKTIAILTDLNAMFEDKTPAEGEIEMIRSRTLLGAVVKQLALDIEARPRKFPVIGDAIWRRYHGQGPAPPVLGLSRFAWGGERIQLRRLDVSDDLVDDFMSLVALEGGRYRLSAAGGKLQVEGQVGEAAYAMDGERRVELLVSELRARPGTHFQLRKRWPADVVDWLQKQLRVIEKGRRRGSFSSSWRAAIRNASRPSFPPSPRRTCGRMWNRSRPRRRRRSPSSSRSSRSSRPTSTPPSPISTPSSGGHTRSTRRARRRPCWCARPSWRRRSRSWNCNAPSCVSGSPTAIPTCVRSTRRPRRSVPSRLRSPSGCAKFPRPRRTPRGSSAVSRSRRRCTSRSSTRRRNSGS